MCIKRLLNYCLLSFLVLASCLSFLVEPVFADEVAVDEDLILIKQIADKASDVADRNDLYASVMIAQALLASDFGKGQLCQPAINNLFSIKGRFKDEFVKWADGQVNDNATTFIEYRKYSSYDDSLNDYVELIKDGISSDPDFYAGSWRSKTVNYREATAFLTTRYAEDPNYAQNLNIIIELYNLTDFDNGARVEDPASIRKNKVFETLTMKKKHVVKENETLFDIAKQYNSSVSHLIKANQLSQSAIVIGQYLVVD